MKLFAPPDTNTDLIELTKELYSYYKSHHPFEEEVQVRLLNDKGNAKDVLGKTAYYSPGEEIGLYITNRHPKDVLRSLCHELTHHCQFCQGKFSKSDTFSLGQGYAQENEQFRELEREAYEKGNMIFRDWEDSKKTISSVRIIKEWRKLMNSYKA